MPAIQTGYAEVNGARLYYEIAGRGAPLVMIHAGIADCRMWNNEFETFAKSHQVIRFDMRGYGRSLPVEGEFNIQDDLRALLAKLNIQSPRILMGCSIGAGLAIDYALTQPQDVLALILVGGAPTGLDIEAEAPDELFAQSEQAFNNGDIDLVAEIDMKIWFDGFGRSPADVDPAIRQQAWEMPRLVTEHERKGIGKHVRKSFDKPAAARLDELKMPVLVIIGENDLPYLRLAADYLTEHLPRASKALIRKAAHLPNMEQPEQFQAAVRHFLAAHSA